MPLSNLRMNVNIPTGTILYIFSNVPEQAYVLRHIYFSWSSLKSNMPRYIISNTYAISYITTTECEMTKMS